MAKFHRVLGCKFKGTAATWSKRYHEEFMGLGHYPPDWYPLECRTDDLFSVYGMVCIHHLGYKVPVDIKKFAKRGVAVARDYFTGDWWQSDPIAAEEMDKSKSTRRLIWFRAFSKGMLLAMLVKDWKTVEAIADWIEAPILGKDGLLEQEQEWPDLYKSVAAHLRTREMAGLDKIETKLRRCKSPRPKALYLAWQAAVSGDQAQYQQLMVEAIQGAQKSFTGMIPSEWIAMHHSVVLNAARRLGMKDPAFTQQQRAVLLVPESLA